MNAYTGMLLRIGLHSGVAEPVTGHLSSQKASLPCLISRLLRGNVGMEDHELAQQPGPQVYCKAYPTNHISRNYSTL